MAVGNEIFQGGLAGFRDSATQGNDAEADDLDIASVWSD